jgi:hypothetical protein
MVKKNINRWSEYFLHDTMLEAVLSDCNSDRVKLPMNMETVPPTSCSMNMTFM